jgi:hypothetical protein
LGLLNLPLFHLEARRLVPAPEMEMTSCWPEPAPYICYACANGRHADCTDEACECSHHASPPESETPETDAELAKLGNYGAYPGTDGMDGVTAQEDFEARILDLCRSLERRLSQAHKALEVATNAQEDAERQAALAQTEIKGHMRIEDDLKAEIERERMRVVGCSVAALGNWKEGDSLHADYDCVAIRDVAKLRVKYDKAQARIAELEKALKAVKTQIVNLPRSSTADTIHGVVDEALKSRA